MTTKKFRVLYLHGFEESPSSPKPALLKSHERLDVFVPDLDVYLTKKNGFIFSLLQNPKLWGTIAVSFIIGRTFSPLIGLIACSVGLVILRKRLMKDAIKSSVEKTYRVAEKALKDHEPDIIVGFSWGSALVCLMLKQQKWNGPCVLLGPAYETILGLVADENGDLEIESFRFNVNEIVLNKYDMDEQKGMAQRVRAVVGTNDTITRPEVVAEFCKRNEFNLTYVDGEPHKLWGFQQLPRLVLDLLMEK